MACESTESEPWDFPGGPVAKTSFSNAGGLGSIPGRGTRFHMLQLRVHMLWLKILHAAMKMENPTYHVTTKTQQSQIK